MYPSKDHRGTFEIVYPLGNYTVRLWYYTIKQGKMPIIYRNPIIYRQN